MPAKTATAGAERILHCSPDRSIYECVDGGKGGVVVKLFVTGSLADAEHEMSMAQSAAGPGVARYLELATDPAGRPSIRMAREDGCDLDRIVAERGALPAEMACRLLAPIAATLARLHGRRAADTPAGLCHGDVKPKNLIRTDATTVLLDFEHARPIGTSSPGDRATPNAAAFSGGTRAFAPPEAGRGAAPDAAFDVYGLGSTLAWMLKGGAASGPPQHPAVEELLAACGAPDPRARPTAAEVAARLSMLAALLAVDVGEVMLADWATATFAAGDVQQPDDPRCRPWRRRQRLTARRPLLLRPNCNPPADAVAILAEQREIGSILRRFPRHPPTLERRRRLALATSDMIAGAAARTQAACRAEEFAAAVQELEDLARAAIATLQQPGGLPLPAIAGPANVSVAHRDPLAFLRRLQAQVTSASAELEADLDVIHAAEQQLDLDAAETAVAQLAARCGGASPAAARVRDRLHRLTFYLHRVARSEPNVERIGPLWDATALRPLTQLVATAAATHRGSSREAGSTAVGLRSLQLTLINLTDEFPHLRPVAPALDVLSHALAHLTEQAWQELAAAQQRLQMVPVPVRPLQLALGRLDTFRILEALVDQPERPRSRLLDDIEALRLGFEQARASRDRLALSAEHALARGHWTTGLFDMERAVAGLQPGDEHERAEADRLHVQLEEARRNKREVEARVRRSVDLTTHYGNLQDDPSSTFADRLAALAERRDCLMYLTLRVPADRALLYRQDLQDVEIRIALERAAQAEYELDGAVEPAQRLQLARRTLDELSQSLRATDDGAELPGRLVRLLEHWRTVTGHCERAVQQRRSEHAALGRQRRRLWFVAIVAALITTAAIVLAIRAW